MKEHTYIFDLQVTAIVNDHDSVPLLDEKEKREFADFFKRKLRVDDVNVLDVKIFERDLTEERDDETEQ